MHKMFKNNESSEIFCKVTDDIVGCLPGPKYTSLIHKTSNNLYHIF